MKTLVEISKNTKITTLNFWLLCCGLAMLMLQSCVSTVYVPERRTTVVTREVAPPPWAPPYDNVSEVHYYYLPDIEMYYDVWNHEYVYLNNGNWVFTASLPVYYSNYDINNAFVVVLDYRVQNPWRQHQQYVSHYPRYYYRSVYNEDNRHGNHNTTVINNYGGVRGFNENARTPIYRNAQPSNNTPSRRYAQPRQRSTSTYPVNNQQNQSREQTGSRRNDAGRSYPTESRATPNSNQQSAPRRDVSRSTENNEVNRGQKNENNQPSNVTRPQNNELQNTNNRPARNDNTEQKKTIESSRTQPAVYTGREVGQPVKVKREAQPAQQKRTTKTEKKEVKQDDSKNSSNAPATSRRR